VRGRPQERVAAYVDRMLSRRRPQRFKATAEELEAMLAGRAPFEDRDPLAMLGAHVSRRPPAFSVVAPGVDIPRPLEEIIQHGLKKSPGDRIGTARSSRMDAGTTVERVHLDARVLADRPLVLVRVSSTEQGLAPRVLVVRLAVLGRKVVCLEGLDRPGRQQVLELTRLARVARREARLQSVHRTSTTFSSSASCETSPGG